MRCRRTYFLDKDISALHFVFYLYILEIVATFLLPLNSFDLIVNGDLVLKHNDFDLKYMHLYSLILLLLENLFRYESCVKARHLLKVNGILVILTPGIIIIYLLI